MTECVSPPAPAPAAPKPHTDRPLLAISLRLLAMAMLATTYALGKLLTTRGVNIVEIVFYRQLCGLPIAAIWLLHTLGPRAIPIQRWRTHGLRAFLGMTGMLLNFGAVALLPLAEATSIGFTMPIFATLLSALLLRERTGLHRWGAVLLGFVGVLIMARPDTLAIAPLGLIVALAGAIFTALVAIVLRDLGRTDPAPVIVFWFTLFSLPPLALLMIRFAQGHDLVSWLLLLCLGLAGGVGQLLLTSALKWGPVSIVTTMDYSQIIWATWFGWLFWQVLPAPTTWIGVALIVASGLYIAWRQRVRHRPEPISPQEDRGGRSG